MLIYKVTNLINNKVYIGKTIKTLEERKNQHLRDSKKLNLYFYYAINKYTPNEYHWEIIQTCKNEKELSEREKYWIKYFDTSNADYGYNCTKGGDGGDIFTLNPNKEKIRLNISKSKKGRNNPNYGKKFSKEICQKMSESKKGLLVGLKNGMFGKHHSKETREKLSKKLSGENNPQFGTHHSEETRKKISQNTTYKRGRDNPWFGRKHTEETKRKISESNKGKNHPMFGKHISEEHKKKITGRPKKEVI